MMDVYRQFGGVLLVFSLLGALLWLANRRGWAQYRPGRLKMIAVLETVTLTPQHRLHVLAIDGRRLLIATSPGSCQLMTEIRPAEDIA